MCKFSIAVSRNFTNANGEKEVDYINIVVWRALAENCSKYLKKGSKVGVSGRLEVRSYEQEGQKRYATEVVADEVSFLSSSNKEALEGKQEAQKGQNKKASELTSIDDEGLPF